MKSLLASLVLALSFGAASAQTRMTYDWATGNQYFTTHIGNQSVTNGYNANTGSSWSQNTQNYGNFSYTNGTDSEGRSWSSNVISTPGATFYSGTDSEGNSHTTVCTSFGCY